MSSDKTADAETKVVADFVLGEAVRLLEKFGEFFPIASSMSLDGEADYVMADIDDDMPPSDELIDLYVASFKQEAAEGTIKCVAIAYEIFVRDRNSDRKRDAIAIRLEHESGKASLWVNPYELTGGKVVLGAHYSELLERKIF